MHDRTSTKHLNAIPQRLPALPPALSDAWHSSMRAHLHIISRFLSAPFLGPPNARPQCLKPCELEQTQPTVPAAHRPPLSQTLPAHRDIQASSCSPAVPPHTPPHTPRFPSSPNLINPSPSLSIKILIPASKLTTTGQIFNLLRYGHCAAHLLSEAIGSPNTLFTLL
jgi:hypothetical protein